MKQFLLKRLSETLERQEVAAVATVVDIRGSVPQVLGARIAVIGGNETAGTIGGGAVEHRVLKELRDRCAKPGDPTRLKIDLTKDLGMCCGGTMTFLVENIMPNERLVIFGAGHVAKPVAQLAQTADFSVVVVDDREEFNNGERFTNCEHILMEPAEAARHLHTTDRDYLLAVTHDHRLDEDALRIFGALPHRYFGLIGSQRKVQMVKKRVEARDVTLDDERLYAPVGIAIGSQTPEEIAISIVAELIAVRRGFASAHLRSTSEVP